MRTRHAVTLIELMIGMVVLAILSVSVYISLAGSTDDANEAQLRSLQAQMQAELDLAYARSVQQSENAWLEIDHDWQRAALPDGKPAPQGSGPQPAAAAAKGTQPLPPASDPPDLALLETIYLNVQPLDAKYPEQGLCAVYTSNGLRALVLGKKHPEIQRTLNDADERILLAIDISSVMSSAGTFLSGFGTVPDPVPMGLSPDVDSWLLLRIAREGPGNLALRTMQLGDGGSSFDAYFQEAAKNVSPLDYAIFATLLGAAGINAPKRGATDGAVLIDDDADFLAFLDAAGEWQRRGIYFNTGSLVETGDDNDFGMGSLYDLEQVFGDPAFMELFSQIFLQLDDGNLQLTMEELGFTQTTSSEKGYDNENNPVTVTVTTVTDFYGNVITQAISTPQSWGSETVETFYSTIDQSHPLGEIVYQYDSQGRLIGRVKNTFDALTQEELMDNSYSASYHGTGTQPASETYETIRSDGSRNFTAQTFDAQGNELSRTDEVLQTDGSRRRTEHLFDPTLNSPFTGDGRVHIYDQVWDQNGEISYEYLQEYNPVTGVPEYYRFFSLQNGDGEPEYVLQENRYDVLFDAAATVPTSLSWLGEPTQFSSDWRTSQFTEGQQMDPTVDTIAQGGSAYSALSDTEASVLSSHFGGQPVWRERTIIEQHLDGDDFSYGESMRWESQYYPLQADGLTPDTTRRVSVTTQFREEFFGNSYVDPGLGWNGGGMYELYTYEQLDPATGQYVSTDAFMQYAEADGTQHTYHRFPVSESSSISGSEQLNSHLRPGWYEYDPSSRTWLRQDGGKRERGRG